MKALVAIALAVGLVGTASAQQPASSSPLIGKWCLERPREMRYGSTLGLVIDTVTGSSFTGQYNWQGSEALNIAVKASSLGNQWELWPDRKIWYRLDKSLDAQGHIVGTGGNNALGIKWPAIFTRVAATNPSVDKQGVRVMVPGCPQK